MSALMISTGAHYHWVKKISAHTNGGGALSLTLHGDREAHDSQFNQAEITVFTDDVALTERLIKAINGAAEAETIAEQPIATVINNNQPGWTNIIETAPNVTLDVGTKLYRAA